MFDNSSASRRLFLFKQAFMGSAVVAVALLTGHPFAVAQQTKASLGLPVARESTREQTIRLPAVSNGWHSASSPSNHVQSQFASAPTSGQLSKNLNEFDFNAVYPPPMLDWQQNFSPTPLPAESLIYNPVEEGRPYDGKSPVDVQRPIVELGRPFYSNGMLDRGSTFLGETNLITPHFYVYGDYRIGYGGGTNAAGDFSNIATQFRLDLDWMFTSTERVHGFVQPFTRGNDFTGIDFRDGGADFQEFFNVDFVTGFFEGDWGAIVGGFDNTSFPFDAPFTVGLVPLLYQNGIWMEDAVTGAAFAIPHRNSKLLKWSNFDATFFAAIDQLNTDAFPGDKNAAQLLGTAWFIEAYEGYIEAGYAYIRDRQELGRSYHNITLSYARRYLWRISNTLRVIANVGQDLPREQRTADGVLVLLENAWISSDALRFVPYVNLFAGFRKPQSVARAGVAGGILRNTGINFESDNLNGFSTLDPTANNTYGFAAGVNLLGSNFDQQLVAELAYVGVMENPDDRNARGQQAAAGLRYQLPLTHRTLIRLDGMWGWREFEEDLVGGRIEYRWKF